MTTRAVFLHHQFCSKQGIGDTGRLINDFLLSAYRSVGTVMMSINGRKIMILLNFKAAVLFDLDVAVEY